MTPVLRVRTITSKRVHLKMSVETGPNAHLIIWFVLFRKIQIDIILLTIFPISNCLSCKFSFNKLLQCLLTAKSQMFFHALELTNKELAKLAASATSEYQHSFILIWVKGILCNVGNH